MPEEIDRVVLQSVELHLKDETYDETLVSHWVDRICDSCIKGLNDLKKPFKYIGMYMTMSADTTLIN